MAKTKIEASFVQVYIRCQPAMLENIKHESCVNMLQEQCKCMQNEK